jgi:hypothetical protein
MLPRITPQPVDPPTESETRPRVQIHAKIIHILFIFYSLEVGIALLVLPWLNIWDNNLVLYVYPQIVPVVTNPFFKGAVLGLGIDSILVGIYEVAHIKRGTRGFFPQ